ncbi:MAG: LCP family protein [Firmicutes bacterium]|nr:LCP family protein [Bacillota bacterium]
MRSDRRREIEAQMAAEKRENRRKGGNAFCRFISIIYTLLAAGFMAMLGYFDVLPGKYYWTAVGVLTFISLFIVPVMFSRHGKKGRKIVATVIAFLLIGVFGVGTYYMIDTVDFLGEITEVKEVTEDYHVVVKAEELYETVDEITGQTLGTYMVSDLTYSEAKAILQQEVNVQYAYEETIGAAFEKLYADEYKAIFISAAAYEGLKTEDPELETKTKVLHTVKIKIETEDQTHAADVTAEAFNVYISGIDIEGNISTVSRSDVNMVATINPVTNEVLLTAIPRDYYVTLPSKSAKDKLTHSGLYGVQESIGAVEDFMGVDINYYVRVNYTTVVKLVDAMGGIEVDSPHAFTTSGMGSLNGHTFVKGINKLDGRAALAFCRERKSFANGDMQRNENQQLVMEGIIRKAVSSTTLLTKYTSILEAVQSNMETNMTMEEMSSLIKMQLDGMPSWNIQKQSIKGANGYDLCYALGFKAAIVEQNPVENAKATDNIIKVMTGEVEIGENDGTEENQQN